ncbi:MAG: CsgG/HfaB family protein [Candidatus Cloacimonetes bacterium]|jgi:tetratricopeptide (TPR) repeat protein|nr:CsgG/HfaB family protein [Candidatus Cloacimonadota bacterium]MDD2506656.1 CsgG/HfaB family protein [Candidatus Cloacimonadota bacterium]MDD4147073.1 CsgG/HfaB family protein [Candidatus Cloacimonadota bacterium]MDD4560272.1 CsgG/HfaB family protein [Candidatus Cloacimonadota bacterium]
MKIATFRVGLGILCIALALSACARNKKYLSKAENERKLGNYETAAFYAIESLKLKPDYRKAQIALKESYPLAIVQRKERLLALQARDEQDNLEDILVEYMALQKLSDAIRSLPAIINPETGMTLIFDSSDYSAQIADTKTMCAEMYYQKGLHQSRMDTSRTGQRLAAEHFKRAMVFVPNYLDSASRYESARQNAVTRVAILPFDDVSGFGKKHGAASEILSAMIVDKLLQKSSLMEYSELITRDRIEQVLSEQEFNASGLVEESSTASIGHLLGANAILSGKILQIAYNAPRVISKDISETGIVEEESDNEVKEKEISCSFTEYTMNSSMQVVASYTLLEVSSGKILAHKNFNPTYTFNEKWGKVLSGDARALSKKQQELVNTTEALAPSPAQMLHTVLENLSDELTEHISGYMR